MPRQSPQKRRKRKRQTTPRTEFPSGATLRRILKGHTQLVNRISWCPDGSRLASASNDGTLRVWDSSNGETIHTLKGHIGHVYGVSWSPDLRLIASGGKDHSVRIWDADDGSLVRSFAESEGWILGLAWSPDGQNVAAGSEDGLVRVWDVKTGQMTAFVDGAGESVTALAWSVNTDLLAAGFTSGRFRVWSVSTRDVVCDVPTGDDIHYVAWVHATQPNLLATAGQDESISIWDVESVTKRRILEGHTDSINCIAFSADGKLLASLGECIRLWRCDTWEPVAASAEIPSGFFTPGLAFHPTQLALAAVGTRAGIRLTPSSDVPRTAAYKLIYIWDLDYGALVGGVSDAVHHTTAKIVIVGDSGVGKTGLGWRLAHGRFKEHPSTHGQQFWVLRELSTRREDGTDCEAILWDLAGQPDYRLIHALFVDDADLALIVFDATHTTDPLHGVEYWLNQLNVARAESCPTILVGARSDRGTARLSDDDLTAFCVQRGISGGYVATSALHGDGLAALLELMKRAIPWEQKTAIVTSATFKRIKDFILSLKEKRNRDSVLLAEEELRTRLEKSDSSLKFSDEEMMTAVGHLSNYGYVRVLRSSTGEARILLAPEVLNNLAASLILEARRNPRGLGALEEKRMLSGGYSFRDLDAVPSEAHSMLLETAAIEFLKHHVCFRETDPLRGESYLIFPELINLNKPVIADEQATEDGVSYTVSGATENVYASLVVLLGYTNQFTRTDQWRHSARYEVGEGLICGFRQSVEEEGELTFVLYFGTNVSRPIRILFQGLFESFLANRDINVSRLDPVFCPGQACNQPLARNIIRAQLRKGKHFAFCSDCGTKIALRPEIDPIQLTQLERGQVEAQQRTATARTRFEQVLFQFQSYVVRQSISAPECFISYAWGSPEQERWVEKRLAMDLQKGGIVVMLDKWNNSQIGGSISRFIERIEKIARVIVIGTPLYRTKYENKLSTTGTTVAAEVDLISLRLRGTERDKMTVLPCLLAGDEESSLPPLMRGRVYADFRDERQYFSTVFDVIVSLYGLSNDDEPVTELRQSLAADEGL